MDWQSCSPLGNCAAALFVPVNTSHGARLESPGRCSGKDSLFLFFLQVLLSYYLRYQRQAAFLIIHLYIPKRPSPHSLPVTYYIHRQQATSICAPSLFQHLLDNICCDLSSSHRPLRSAGETLSQRHPSRPVEHSKIGTRALLNASRRFTAECNTLATRHPAGATSGLNAIRTSTACSVPRGECIGQTFQSCGSFRREAQRAFLLVLVRRIHESKGWECAVICSRGLVMQTFVIKCQRELPVLYALGDSAFRREGRRCSLSKWVDSPRGQMPVGGRLNELVQLKCSVKSWLDGLQTSRVGAVSRRSALGICVTISSEVKQHSSSVKDPRRSPVSASSDGRLH